MKKLQSNFTTPEQAKRLLELGVPRESSDCYRLHYVYDDYELAEERPERMTLDELEWMLKTDEIDCIVPCWSVGRLIEICLKCSTLEQRQVRFFCNGDDDEYSLIDYVITALESGVMTNHMDFSKMENLNMSTHEVYCSFDISKLLKEAGFDWDTYSAYNKDGVFTDKNRSITTWNDFADYYSAPTLDVAQRWLREVKQCYVQACPMFSFGWTLEYYFVEVVWAYSHSIKQNEFKTYEEAQEAGIKKALKLILEKGE